MTISRDDARRLPKVLLHDHLDGGLRVATIIELAESIGWTLPSTDPDELQAWFTRGAETADLLQYLATFEHTLALLQTAEHIERVAYEAVVDLADDGVVYAEIRLAPELHQQQGLELEDVVEAVTSGLRRGESAAAADGSQITVNTILSAMRTEQRSVEIARLVDRLRASDDKVVAFDLAGAETGFLPSLHAEALAFARSALLNITIHASESPDLELISDAVTHGAHRIGHGVRLRVDTNLVGADPESGDPESGEQESGEHESGEHESGAQESGAQERPELTCGALAQYVLDHQIHLEMAPTCNVQIGAVPSLAEHPIGPFLRAGFNVGYNTDNRLMSQVMPSSELHAVATVHDLTTAEMERLATNAMMSSFAPMEVRRRIVAEQIRPGYR